MSEQESPPPPEAPSSPWRLMARTLLFRASKEELLSLGDRELLCGLLAAWLVGIGRWWDHPGAQALQRTGLGSVAYVFALAIVLWLLYLPWRVEGWGCRKLAAFIALTAAPGLVYAVPVERLAAMPAANAYNTLALALVAAWRVGLLFFYFKRGMSLGWGQALTAALLPVSAIVAGLNVMNMATGVFELMGGYHGPPGEEGAATLVFFLGMLAMPLSALLLLSYVGIIIGRRRARATG